MAMIEQLALFARPLLEFPYVRRVRRNHGLEHATIHVLNRQRYRLSGRSSDAGFVIIGDVPTEKVEAAIEEALSRMQKGEHQLAVHPNCGTNLVTTGLLTTVAGLLGFGYRGSRSPRERFPTVMVMMMFTVLFSQPLGMSLQKHFTTEGDPGSLELVSVTRSQMNIPFRAGAMTMHQVVTKQV